jgi:O-antigen/teichoic acid export membrane protein
VKKYKTHLTSLAKQDFIRHNAIFFIGSLAIAVFNYLYYPVISRMVSVSDFGEIQALISIFMQLGIVLTAFGYVVTNIINNTKNNDESVKVIVRLEQATLLISTALFVLLCLGSVLLQNSLQFSSAIPLILVGLLVMINVPSTSRTYFLQGMKHLKEVSISGVLFAAGKLLLTVLLIMLGNDVLAVMFGYIIAQTVTLLYLMKKSQTFPRLRALFVFEKPDDSKLSAPLNKLVKRELFYGLMVIILLSGVMLLYTSDSIMTRLYFHPEIAGLYSGISAIARIIFFVTASIAGVLIATIKLGDSHQTNQRTLVKSMGLITAIGGAVAIFFSLFSDFSIKLLLGSSYLHFGYLLPLLSLVMMFCAYNNLLVSYQIALRQFSAIIPVVIGVMLLAVCILLDHSSLEAIIRGYLISNVIVCMILSLQIVRRGKP